MSGGQPSVALVTGATGFIGSHVAEVLRGRDHQVRAMVRATSNLRKLDEAAAGRPFELARASLGRVEELVEAVRGVDVVYHVAGQTASFDRAGFDRVNSEGVGNLFEAIGRLRRRGEDHPRRVVQVSSVMAAGPSHPRFARREHDRHQEGYTLYGDSKLRGEKIAWEVARSGMVEVVIVRPPLVYGPRDEDVLQMIKSAGARVVAQPGLTPTWMSVIHGHDLARAIVLAGERGTPLPRGREDHVLRGGGSDPGSSAEDPLDPRGQGIYYFTDGGRTTVAKFGQAAAAALDRRAFTVPLPKAAVVTAGWLTQGLGRLRGKVPALTVDKARGSLASGWWVDDSRARAELGWLPQMPLERGLEDTIRWLRDNALV